MEFSRVPNLRFLHAESTLNRAKLEQFSPPLDRRTEVLSCSRLARFDRTERFWMAIIESACLQSVGKTSISSRER